MKHMLQVKREVQMTAHSSKYLTAAHSSMALATTALQGLLPCSVDGCSHHTAHTWEGLTGGMILPWE